MIHKDSHRLIRELKKYIYKTDKNDKTLEMPVDMDNHALDAMRYAINTHGRKYWLNAGSALASLNKERKSRFSMSERF